MNRTTAWKRLATIGATTAVIAGMSPFVGVVAAHASVGSVQLVDPLDSTIITTNNGGDNLQHLYADVTQSTNTDPQIAFVVFSEHDTVTSTTTTQIAAVHPKTAGVDGAGHESLALATWQVPSNTDAYTVTAQGVEANQTTTVGGASTNNVTVTTGVGVTLSRPLNNSTVGYYALTSKLNVQGTTSATATAVKAESTPTGVDPGNATTGTSGVYNGQSTTWAADIGLSGADAAPTAGHNTSLTGVKASTASGAEDAPGTAYLQKYATSPNGVTLTPTSGNGCAASGDPSTFSSPPTTADCKNTTSSNPFQIYTLQATDQNGNPISGLPIDLTFTDPSVGSTADSDSVSVQFRSTSGAATWTPSTGTTPTNGTPVGAPASGDYGTAGDQLTTNQFGQITFRVSNTQAEVVQIDAKSKFDGSYINGTDYDLHGQYSTVAQVPTSGTATIIGHPTAPLYATQSYGLGNAQTGPTPGIQVNVKDASNNPVQGATVQYSYVRNVTAGKTGPGCSDTNHYPVTVPTDPSSTALTSNGSDASGNIYVTPDAATSGHSPYLASTSSACEDTEVGNDVFTVYIDKNGVPGFQSGGDTLLGTDTLAFGPESLYFKPCDQITTYQGGNVPYANTALQDCSSQQKSGTDLTLTVFDSIWDGTTRQPVTSRKVDITIPTGGHMTFSSTGNSGLVLVNPAEGNITTGSDGTATVTVTDPSAGEDEQVTASDPTLTDAITSDDATDLVHWRSFSPTLNSVVATGTFYKGEVTPLSDFSDFVGSPGQPLIEGFVLRDQNGSPLENVPFTITTSGGFLTDLPNLSGAGAGHNATTYKALHFDGSDATPADGAQIQGNLHSNGTSETVVSDGSGRVFFALGIKADPEFAADGVVVGDVTAQLNGTGTTLTLPDNDGDTSPGSHQVLFSTDNRFGDVAALNPAATNPLTLQAGLFDNNGRYHVTNLLPSGDKATTSTNTIPVDTVDTTSTQTDGFGNVVSEPIDTSTTGANGPDTGSYFGAYGFVNNDTADDLGFSPNGDGFGNCDSNSAAQSAGACPEIANGPGSTNPDLYINQLTDPASNVPVTGNETLTADWNANHTTWLVNGATHAVSINVTNAPDPTKSYTVDWYDREASGFKYRTTFNPAGSTHQAGTPVTSTLMVLDSKNRPVNGLGVEFIRSGPNGETQDTGNPFTCAGTCQNVQFTNVSGQAGFTFISHSTGKFTITAIVTDASGNEVGRAVTSGTLTGQKNIKVTIRGPHSVVKGSSHKLHGTAPAHHSVTIFRGGHAVATVQSNAHGKWSKKLKFTHSHAYYAMSTGVASGTLHVKVHKKKHHKKH